MSRGRVQLIMAVSGMAYMLSSPSALPQVSQGTEGASGQQAFNNACRTCHVMREGDNRLGPNLHKIIGRKAGSLPDYNYSSAMKEAGWRRPSSGCSQRSSASIPVMRPLGRWIFGW